MKKIILSLVAVFAMSVPAMAQGSCCQEKKPADKTQMVQGMTDQMVKKYGLDESQAKKLKALNEEYAAKMPMGGGQGHCGKHKGGAHKGAASVANGQSAVDGTTGATQQAEALQKSKADKKGADFKQNKEAYDKELKKILGDEKYEQYQNDRKQAMQRGPKSGKKAAGGCGNCGNCGAKDKK